MASLMCFKVVSNQVLVSIVPDVTACAGGYVSVSATDYVSLSSLGTLFQTYFAFDDAAFAEIVAGLLLVFSSGHILGRIIGAMRKTF